MEGAVVPGSQKDFSFKNPIIRMLWLLQDVGPTISDPAIMVI
jgi:hypothetical protein